MLSWAEVFAIRDKIADLADLAELIVRQEKRDYRLLEATKDYVPNGKERCNAMARVERWNAVQARLLTAVQYLNSMEEDGLYDVDSGNENSNWHVASRSGD